ncbi:MAG: transposase [Dehalococcoidia bacterium]|nr:transposase [Dehalococcoidia bacterium]
MRKSKYTEEQIVGVLKEHEAGAQTAELCRRRGISQQTLYRWKAKYGGLGVGDAQRLKALEDENRRLKKLVAYQRSTSTP